MPTLTSNLGDEIGGADADSSGTSDVHFYRAESGV
jgi:hypothetical protein